MNSFSKDRHSSQTTSHHVVIPPSPERPIVSEELAIHLAELHFNIQVVKIKEFESYGDRNFYLETAPKTAAINGVEDDGNGEFVLKILNYVESAVEGMVEAQNEAMLFLKNHGLDCAVPVLSSNGSYIVLRDCDEPEKILVARDKGRRMNVVRLVRYLPGEVLKDVPVLTEDLLFELGQYIGKMDKILKDFHYPRLKDHIFIWDMQHLNETKPYITAKYLGSKDRENLIMNVYNQYFATVPQVLQKCSKQVIHNDVNESNIILTQDPSDVTSTKWSIAGVIDFGDVCYSYRVFEIAIAMAHCITLNYCRGNPRPFESAGRVLKGYQSIYPISPEELTIIYWCIAGRFIQILILSSKTLSMDQDNEYVDEFMVKVWKVLPEYLKFSSVQLLENWMKN